MYSHLVHFKNLGMYLYVQVEINKLDHIANTF